MEMFDKILNFVKSPKVYTPIIAILVTFILISILNKTVKKLIKKNDTKISTKKRNTIVILMSNIVRYVIILFTALIILSSWGIDVSSILAGLGIAGVVGGLALQDALKDIIMGCNIILDNFYVVGDYITYEDFTGEVIEFGLKNTKVKDSLNHVLVISNRNVNKIINYSQGDFSLALTINVAYEENNDKVETVINEIVDNLKDSVDKLTDVKFLGLSKLSDSSVQYKILLFCMPVDQYEVERKSNFIIKKMLDKNKIKIPYTQLEVHNGK